MTLSSFIIIIIQSLCSVLASILSCWHMLRDLSSLSMKQLWMLAIDLFASCCLMSYALYQHPLSLFLIGCDISPPISQLLCFIAFVYCRFGGSQSPCLEFRTIMALGTPPLIFITVNILWIFDVGGLCFVIFAILAEISSSILSLVQLWRGRTSGDWLILVLLRHILEVISGVVELLMGIWEHNILSMINSAVVFVFGLVQLGVAFYTHEIHGIPWFSRGTSSSLPSESEGPSGS